MVNQKFLFVLFFCAFTLQLSAEEASGGHDAAATKDDQIITKRTHSDAETEFEKKRLERSIYLLQPNSQIILKQDIFFAAGTRLVYIRNGKQQDADIPERMDANNPIQEAPSIAIKLHNVAPEDRVLKAGTVLSTLPFNRENRSGHKTDLVSAEGKPAGTRYYAGVLIDSPTVYGVFLGSYILSNGAYRELLKTEKPIVGAPLSRLEGEAEYGNGVMMNLGTPGAVWVDPKATSITRFKEAGKDFFDLVIAPPNPVSTLGNVGAPKVNLDAEGVIK